MLGALIGAGASIIGSLLGSKKEKPQQTTTRINYKQMVEDAEAAGFNPLTALRAGGGAGFTTTTHPALSGYSPIGNAFQTVGAALANYDPQANARADLETKLLTAQLANVQADTKQRMRSFEVPVRTGATAHDQSGNAIRSAAAQGGIGFSAKPEQGDFTVTNPYGFGQVAPDVPDAQQFEDRNGEILGSIYGGYVMLKDGTHMLKEAKPLGVRPKNWSEAFERLKKNLPEPRKGPIPFKDSWLGQDLAKFEWF